MMGTVLQLLANGILAGGIYALISIGLCLIFGVIEVVNFAHGEFLMLSMYATYWLFNLAGVDPYLSVFIVIPIAFLVGLAVQRLIIQNILESPPINQIFVTVGISIVLQNIALLFWKANYRTIHLTYIFEGIKTEYVVMSYPRIVAFLAAVVGIISVMVFLKYTYIGKAIRAISQERRAAMLMGINIYKTYGIAFGIGIACTALAGGVLLPIYYVYPTVGSLFVLIAFVVVVLGGYNNLMGVLVGGLIIGVVEAMSGYFLSPHLKEPIYFTIFIIVLIIKPSGLFGRKQ